MNATIAIRAPKTDELADIAKLTELLATTEGRQNVNRTACLDRIANISHVIAPEYHVVASDTEVLAQMLLFRQPAPMDGGDLLFVDDVITAPAHRGQGAGHALVSSAIDYSTADPLIRGLRLLVKRGNHRAIRLYEKLGFEIQRDTFLMQKWL